MDLPERVKPVIQTDRSDVFRTSVSVPTLDFPRDVYLAFHRHEDVARPICVVTIWPTAPAWGDDGKVIVGGSKYVEWCHVDEEFRREGIATEVLLGIQNFIGPLSADGMTDEGAALAMAIGDKLLGTRNVFRDDWLETQGYGAEQRADIQHEARLEFARKGLSADFSEIFESHKPDTTRLE